MERKTLLTTLGTLAALGTLTSCGAIFASATASTSIPIVNPDFNVVLESAGSSVTGTLAGYSSGWGSTTFSSTIDYSDGSSSTSGYVPGWTGAGGEQVLGATTTAPNPRSGGSYGYSNYGAITQTLSTNVMPNTTYLLTLGVDDRYSGSSPYWYLTAGGTQLSNGAYIGNPAGSQQAPNTVAELVTTGSSASGALGITLGNNSGGQVLFNNVSLVANPANVPTISQNAVSVMNLGTTAPTPGTYDQSNLAPTATPITAYPGSPSGNTTINYFTNNSGAPAGETFTTGTNTAGYLLNSITVLDASESGGFADGTSITVNVSSVNGSNFSTLAILNGTVATGTAAASGDYLKINLTSPITLAANSVYGYSLVTGAGYSGLGVDPNADYAGGQLAMFTPGGASNLFGGTLTTSTLTPNAIFDVGLTPVSAVPAPATLAIFGLGGLAMLGLKRRRA
jgi:hypothetical protein